jgi:hypothetical protein
MGEIGSELKIKSAGGDDGGRSSYPARSVAISANGQCWVTGILTRLSGDGLIVLAEGRGDGSALLSGELLVHAGVSTENILLRLAVAFSAAEISMSASSLFSVARTTGRELLRWRGTYGLGGARYVEWYCCPCDKAGASLNLKSEKSDILL